MLRVAMITDRIAFADKVDGGVQAVTKYLVNALTQLQLIDLHVLCFDNNTEQSTSSEENGFTQHVLPASQFGTLTAFFKDQKTLNSRLRHIAPDIVHGQDAGRNGILAARSPYPSVITIHGILAEEAKFFASLKRRAQHHLLAFLSGYYCIRRATHTILISPYVADYYAKKLNGQKYLIPNPISNSFFNISRRAESGRVLFAGRLTPLKGIMELIRATALLANNKTLQVVLAGSLEQKSYVREVREEVASLDLVDVVQFRGLLSEQEMRHELARCSLLVLPSYQETAPMVIAEAMAAGVPVIASNVGGVRHQLDDGVNGYLTAPGDIEGLAEKMDLLLSNPITLQRFSKNARKAASERYFAQNIAEQTIDVYRSILSNSRRE